MTTVSDAYAVAVRYQQARQLQEAEQIYRQILAIDPNHAAALHLLGMIDFQSGRLDLAIQRMTQAIALNSTEFAFHINLGSAFQSQGNRAAAVRCYTSAVCLRPDLPEAHFNLGTVYLDMGNLAEAIACFRRAAELKPDLPEPHNNLGLALQAQGELDNAIASYHQALALKPQFPEAHNNLGNCLSALGMPAEAVIHYQRALDLKPDYAQAHYNLGNALQAQGNLPEAIASYRRALAASPNYPEANSNLASALKKLGDLPSAVACYRRVVELTPTHAEAHYNLGEAFLALGDPQEAADSSRRALELEPAFAKAHFNLANASRQLGQYQAAFEGFNKTLELSPDYADAHFNRSMWRLLHGDFEYGWPEYEWRWKTNQLVERQFVEPPWNGEPLNDRTILLHAEQGLGDTMQFVRYAAIVKQQNPRATAVVECQRPLRKLLATCPGIDRLVAQGDDLPPFAVHAPMLSLPRILKTTLDTIPANVPYLFADSSLVEKWRHNLEEKEAAHDCLLPTAYSRPFRIGINWQGRAGQGEFRQRDIPLDHFFQLAQIPGIHLISLQKLVSLQKDARPGESGGATERLPILDPGSDLDTLHGPFMDTAAIMQNLDLVITSDTSIPHLAGALGVPVWLALPHVPDWRWLLARSDSPWYPTMRLFRQKSLGDWSETFLDLSSALRDRLEAFAQGPAAE